MIAPVVRGIGSVLTVVVAILVTTRVGETASARILGAALSAVVLIALEWFIQWSPRRLTWARDRLDARAVWTGVWVQQVILAWSTAGVDAGNRNRLSVFRVVYDDGYWLIGRAYDTAGLAWADWESRKPATFSKNGREMSYEWTGIALDGSGPAPDRTGLSRLALDPGDKDHGSGQVQHVMGNLELKVKVERINDSYLRKKGLGDRFTVAALEDEEARQEFAVALAGQGSADPPVNPRRRLLLALRNCLRS